METKRTIRTLIETIQPLLQQLQFMNNHGCREREREREGQLSWIALFIGTFTTHYLPLTLRNRLKSGYYHSILDSELLLSSSKFVLSSQPNEGLNRVHDGNHHKENDSLTIGFPTEEHWQPLYSSPNRSSLRVEDYFLFVNEGDQRNTAPPTRLNHK
ncbi:hypothetical protein O6H91_15G003200 [Diphasiastrum complanatum]|uniref:Uncharacterized protein n=1 Tax=Diphasiastrum complanatum TaxID=34168 RepID=A0ACC2BG56_DIPCM|nr:hypothetical protein O6H91_15G003200 [Diphasiastrum complanatum]